MAIKAITKVAKTDKDGNLYIGRKALRDAVFAEKFDGHERTDRVRSVRPVREVQACVFEFISDDPKTFSMGKNPKKVWP